MLDVCIVPGGSNAVNVVFFANLDQRRTTHWEACGTFLQYVFVFFFQSAKVRRVALFPFSLRAQTNTAKFEDFKLFDNFMAA